jgi:uncharacterized protein HemY
MRIVILAYFILFLLSVGIFIVLSFHAGFGYVFLQWHGWQLQTNLFLVLILFFISLIAIYACWYGLKQIFRRNIQNHLQPKSFQKLHPYERLGILWLLKAEAFEQQQIISTYQASALLHPLIRAQMSLNQLDTSSAKDWLKQSKNPLFELAELLKIDIALVEENHTEAFERIEFLSVQPLSTWLQPVATAYQAQLQEKWLQLSLQYPWKMFDATHQPQFDQAQNVLWLQALFQFRERADERVIDQLKTWIENQKSMINDYPVEHKIILLKLMVQFEQFDLQSFAFAEQILEERFVPDVLYIWLDQVFEHAHLDIDVIASKIEAWSTQYPAQPSIAFAKWHIAQAQGKIDEANELLTQYPEDPYMAYLRIKSALASDDLQLDLKRLLQFSDQDFKFNL